MLSRMIVLCPGERVAFEPLGFEHALTQDAHDAEGPGASTALVDSAERFGV